jgi:hypothetical protein
MVATHPDTPDMLHTQIGIIYAWKYRVYLTNQPDTLTAGVTSLEHTYCAPLVMQPINIAYVIFASAHYQEAEE